MSAVDEVHAALDRLTHYRDEASHGPWEHETGSHEVTNTDGFVGLDIYPYDAELIAILHATIDVQTRLLADVLACDLGNALDGLARGGFFGKVVDLARAINGATA